jgi:hypothetical protein
VGDLSDALRAGITAATTEFRERAERPAGERFASAEHAITCPHCGGERFDAREALLNSTVLTALSLDWLDRSATALVCTTCTHIIWFASRPDTRR